MQRAELTHAVLLMWPHGLSLPLLYSHRFIYSHGFKFTPPTVTGMWRHTQGHTSSRTAIPFHRPFCLLCFPSCFLILPALERLSGGDFLVGREGARARLVLSVTPTSHIPPTPPKETPPRGCPSPLLQGLGKVSSSFPHPTPPTHCNQGDIKKC